VKKAIEKVAEKRKRPDFSGTPGELVPPEKVPENIHWGNNLRGSPYDGLLQSLAQAAPGTGLSFGDAKARQDSGRAEVRSAVGHPAGGHAARQGR
jgi:hypothetical protein